MSGENLSSSGLLTWSTATAEMDTLSIQLVDGAGTTAQGSFALTSVGGGSSPLDNPLMSGPSNLAYLGAFTAPSAFSFGGAALSLGPQGPSPPAGCIAQTLYCANISGRSNSGLGAFYLPKDANLNNTASFVTSTYIAPPAGGICGYIISNTSQNLSSGNGLILTGSHYDVANNRVLLGYAWYYPASQGVNACTLNCAVIDPSMDLSSIQIDQRIGTVLDGSNYAACWGGAVAPEWQPYVGGTTLAGMGVLAIISVRTSFGPPISAFNPSNLTIGQTLPVTTLTYYGNPGTSHPTEAIAGFSQSGWSYGDSGGQTAFNQILRSNSWQLSGEETLACAFIPSGYRTLAVVGTHCAGPYVYGSFTANPALGGTVQTTATFTGTVTSGVAQISNITNVVGTISNAAVCALDAQGFYASPAGMNSGTAITAYNSSTGVATLTHGTPTVNGTFNFAVTTGDVVAYDLQNEDKGTHAYPYYFWLWLYDMADIVKVIAGQISPWQVQPYFLGKLPTPPPSIDGSAGPEGSPQGQGCYDPSTGRYYMALNPGRGSTWIGVWQLS